MLDRFTPVNLETWFFKTGPIIFFNSKDRQTAADGGQRALTMPRILIGAFTVFIKGHETERPKQYPAEERPH
ncbi:MAG: hypothetical protein STSR0001_19840 [Methanothrix sp.]